ncbi:MAG: AAA domain-containing protein [Candidatus Latescibacteria bacterium]|nr:AAA domain-containing protein [Candidatus Latescibacterota bacterium]
MSTWNPRRLDAECLFFWKRLTVERALDHQDKRRENRRLRSQLQSQYSSANIIGKAPNMRQVFDLVDTVAPSRATVLVTGESGTGKELVARALHYNSERGEGPFIRLNCAALPKDLLESELFGHEKGAFTGAIRQTRGRFEMADGGTLLLDEISEIDLSLQAKLLRVLQEREFERIGSDRTIAVDVRIVATTNRNLLDEAEAGRFRQDLYYRLNVIEIELPPLRQRREDIPSLARHFIEVFNDQNGKSISGLDEEALNLLLGHHWPGNVRELENCLERAVVVAAGPLLQVEDLPRALTDGRASTEGEDLPEGMILHEMERRLILRTLQECSGKRTEAAFRLGITPRTLRNKLGQYGAMDAGKKRPLAPPVRRTGS